MSTGRHFIHPPVGRCDRLCNLLLEGGRRLRRGRDGPPLRGDGPGGPLRERRTGTGAARLRHPRGGCRRPRRTRRSVHGATPREHPHFPRVPRQPLLRGLVDGHLLLTDHERVDFGDDRYGSRESTPASASPARSPSSTPGERNPRGLHPRTQSVAPRVLVSWTGYGYVHDDRAGDIYR